MFGLILLDMKLALLSIVLLALSEAAGLIIISRWVSWCIPAGKQAAFIRQRISLAMTFLLGVIIYRYLKDIYLFDPFFHALYTFLIAFSLFYYLTSILAPLVSALAGESAAANSGLGFYMMATLVLAAVVAAKPQASTLGFFTGAAAHVLGRMTTRVRGGKRNTFLLLIGLGIFLLIFLSILSR